MVAEDVQPNEFRHTRKGATSIPLIRSSQPRNRGFVRGRSRGRGESHVQSSYYHESAHRMQHNVNNGTGFSIAETTQHHTTNHDWSQKRPYVTQGSDRPSKHLRLDDPHLENTKWRNGLARLTSGTQCNSYNANRSETEVISISLDLPTQCLRGAFRYNHRRREWAEQQIARLPSDMGLTVINYVFQETAVQFNCRRHEPQGCKQPSGNRTTREIGRDMALAERHPVASLELETTEHLDISHPSSSKQVAPVVPEAKSSQSPVPNGNNEEPSQSRGFPEIGSDRPPGSQHHGTDRVDQPLGNRRNAKRPQFAAVVSEIRPYPADLSSSTVKHATAQPGAIADTPLFPATVLGKATIASAALHVPSSSAAPQQPGSDRVYSFRSGTLVIDPADSHVELTSSANLSRTTKISLANPQAINDAPRNPIRECSLPVESGSSSAADDLLDNVDLDVPHDVLSIDYSPMDHTQPSRLKEVRQEDVGHASRSLRQPYLAPPAGLVSFHRENYDKSRRVLVSPHFGVLCVTSHGAFNLTECVPPRQAHTLRPAVGGARQLIEDACLLRSPSSNYVVAGYSRDTRQISLLKFERNTVTEIAQCDPPVVGEKKGGISAVCAIMLPHMFATGGYDHRVHLWDATKDMARPIPTLLLMKHNSVVQSLLPIRDTSHKLVSAGADCNVHFWDLSSQRVVNTIKTSNPVYHIHEATSPFCTLLEVAHRELQFEIRDHRLVPEMPVLRFGYNTPKPHGRYPKGDVRLNTFACGDKDGSVRLWDLRNVDEPLQIVSCFPRRRITQVVFGGANLVACSEELELAFMDFALGGVVADPVL